jgi:proton-dependent oligopeptide transporter, POT family
MQKIINQTHSKEAYLYAFSKMFERAAYYGLRAIILLYLVDESMKMTYKDAFSLYGMFTISFIFSQVLGAILGDLVIGNKKSIILGGIIQAIGAFSFCIPSTTGLYIGLILVVIGSGLYSPNLISLFGKRYLNKTKLLDSGFTILYLAINIGSVLGPFIIVYIGETYTWSYGFLLAGILMLVSVIFPLIIKEKEEYQTKESKIKINQKVIRILMVIFLVTIFWAANGISSIRILDLQRKLIEFSNFPATIGNIINSIYIFPMTIMAIFLWSYFYYSPYVKLTMGFFFGAVAYGILFLIPEVPGNQHLFLYLFSLFLLYISKIHVSPVVFSILTKYTNPKYLAIVISLAFIPTRIFPNLIPSFLGEEYYSTPLASVRTGLITMLVISAGLICYLIITKKSSS